MSEEEGPSLAGRWKLLLIPAAALLGLGALYLGAVLALGDGVRPGTTVAGQEIGGLSAAEAAARLESTIGKTAAKPLRVKVADQSFMVDPAEAGLRFDPDGTVQGATGRVWNPITIISELTGSREVQPVFTVDEGALASQVELIASAVDTDPVEPVLLVDTAGVRATPGQPGTVLDQQGLREALAAAFMLPRRPVKAALVEQQPTVTAEAVAAGEKLAKSAVRHPVKVLAGTTEVTIPGRAIAQALSFKAVDGAFVPQLDPQVLYDAVSGDLAAIGTPGKDASFKVTKRGKLKVLPSEVGEGVAPDELAAQVATVLGNQPGSRSVSVTFGVREPELTTAELEQLGVKEKISTFTQNFPYAAYRVQNIGQAAEYVDGTLLLPGETFSMNDTIKERTDKNGYTIGFVIGEGGVFAEEMGGGVSAATTAVWTAAFFAGMERVSTRAHSIYITRYQPGLEATVAWGLFDMQFKNDTPYGVLITTKMTNTSLTVDFWSTRIYDKIEAEFGPRTDIRDFPTIYDKSKACLGQDGMEGFKINVDRVFFQNGEEVERQTITTIYRASPKVICGKKPKPSNDVPTFDNEVPAGNPSPGHNGKPSPKPTPNPTPKPTPKPTQAATAAPDPAPQP